MAKTQTPRENPGFDESNKQKPADPFLLDKAIREFVQLRFEEGKLGFFNQYFKGGQRNFVLKKFSDFVNSKDGYRTLANARVSADVFDHEVRRVGYSMNAAIDSAMGAVSSEFEFGTETKTKHASIRNHLFWLSQAELVKIAQSPKEREKAVTAAIRDRAKNYRNTIPNYLKKLKETKWVLTERDVSVIQNHYSNDLESVKAAFRGGVVSQDEIRTIVGLLTDDETKLALMKGFLPSVSLWELVDAKIVNRKKAYELLVEKIKADAAKSGTDIGSMAKSLIAKNGQATVTGDERWSLGEIVKTFDLDTVFVDTALIADETLRGAILRTRLPQLLEEKVEQGFKELENVLKTDVEISELAGAKNYRSVADKIIESFSGDTEGQPKIEGIEEIASRAHLKGTRKLIVEGQARWIGENDAVQWWEARIRIDSWNEYPGNDNDPGTGDATVTVTVLDRLGNPDGATRKLTYSELFRVLSSMENAHVDDEEGFGKRARIRDAALERVGSRADYAGESEYADAVNAEIPNFAEFLARIDALDPSGSSFGMKAGTGFTVGTPGQDDYNVVTVLSVDADNKKIRIRNAHVEGPNQVEELTFANFYLCAVDAKFARMKAIDSPQSILDALAGSMLKSKFEGVGVDDGKFVPKSRRDEPDYEGIRYFVGKDKKAFELGTMENGRVQIRFLEDFDKGEPKEAKGPTAKSVTNFEWFDYEYLYRLIRKYEPQPFEGVVKPKTVNEPEYQSQGSFKKFLNHASFSDFIHGIQEIPKFIKGKLEHSSHHHAAHVTLAMAEKIPGFPSDWLMDLQMQIHSEDKSAMEKEVDRLNKFPSPKRHEQVLKYLLNKGSHDYEIIAGMLSLLEKHGSMYPGPLGKYENDWLFFSRMPGDAGEKEKFLQGLRVGDNGEKKEIKEADAIMFWLREKSKAHHHPVNPHYWLQVKRLWNQGTKGEFDMGGNEAKLKETFDERSKYALGKFKDKEYAHGIWALTEIWNKPSATVTDRMKLPFILAMSEIRTNIHSELAEKFKKMFDDGHTYPPLLFIQFPDRQALFRRIVKKLCWNEDMQKDFKRIEKLIAGETITEGGKAVTLVDELDKFWGKYGSKLGKTLFVTVDTPDLLMRKDEDSDFAEYISIVGEELGDTSYKDVEFGTYSASNANPALLNPKAYVGKFKVNPGNAGLNGEMEKFFAREYIAAIEKIRDVRHPDETSAPGPLTKAWQFKLYREYHKAFVTYVYETVGSPKWNPSRTDPSKLEIEGEHWIMDAMGVGMNFKRPKEKWPKSEFWGPKYDEWVKQDFDSFIANKTVSSNRSTVSASLNQILGQPNSPAPAIPQPNAETPRTETPNPESRSPADIEAERVRQDEEDDAALRKADEEYEGADMRTLIRDNVRRTSGVLRKLGIPVDAETADGRWMKRPIAALLRAMDGMMMEGLGFEFGRLVSKKIGEEIHSHYRVRLLTPLERAEFLARLSSQSDIDHATSILERPNTPNGEEAVFLGVAFENATD